MLKNLLKSLLLVISLLLSVSMAHGKERVAIFQPDLRAPYEDVFRAIVDGIEETADYKVSVRQISSDYSPEKLKNWLAKKNIKAIIALGSRGLKAAKASSGGLPVFAAASLVTPDPEYPNIGGMSLAADPELIFAELKRLSPSVKKVFAVFNPDINNWLIELAKEAAELYGLQLFAMPANDLKQAAIQYKAILNELEPNKHALWLPLDPVTVENRTILPLILRVTWDRNLTVISSNAPHAKRGTLFSTFPKNTEMGRSIGLILNKSMVEPEKSIKILPLDDIGLAVNVRTASHLGLKLSQEDLQRYDLQFPRN